MQSKQCYFALAIAGAIFGVVASGWAPASASPAEGQKLAFSKRKGSCLTCHQIKGGQDAGNVAPPLVNMKARFPDRKKLVAIISDETKRNPQTVMPPFGRNFILTHKEIESIVDFLYTR